MSVHTFWEQDVFGKLYALSRNLQSSKKDIFMCKGQS